MSMLSNINPSRISGLPLPVKIGGSFAGGGRPSSWASPSLFYSVTAPTKTPPWPSSPSACLSCIAS